MEIFYHRATVCFFNTCSSLLYAAKKQRAKQTNQPTNQPTKRFYYYSSGSMVDLYVFHFAVLWVFFLLHFVLFCHSSFVFQCHPINNRTFEIKKKPNQTSEGRRKKKERRYRLKSCQ